MNNQEWNETMNRIDQAVARVQRCNRELREIDNKIKWNAMRIIGNPRDSVLGAPGVDGYSGD